MEGEAARRIKHLSDGVAREITTQVVIQDVEMVVKELLENSLDAGARSVTVTLSGGGTSVRVADDGPGIVKEDLAHVGESHSTSKLVALADLKHLQTYGFRGEGLHAIASQSVLHVVSRASGAASAFRRSVSFAVGLGCNLPPVEEPGVESDGTVITVEQLFAALPVRRQVMIEKQEATHKNLLHMFACYALAHPEVSFRLESAPRPPFVAVAKASLDLRFQDLYGPELWGQVDRVQWSADDASQEHVWIFDCILPRPALSEYNHAVRTKPRVFTTVNKRPVKLDMMTKLVNRVFRAHSGLGSRKYPFILMALTLPPHTYDINLSVEKSKINLVYEERLMEFLALHLEDRFPPIDSQLPSTSSGGQGVGGDRLSGSFVGLGGALDEFSSPLSLGSSQKQQKQTTPQSSAAAVAAAVPSEAEVNLEQLNALQHAYLEGVEPMEIPSIRPPPVAQSASANASVSSAPSISHVVQGAPAAKKARSGPLFAGEDGELTLVSGGGSVNSAGAGIVNGSGGGGGGGAGGGGGGVNGGGAPPPIITPGPVASSSQRRDPRQQELNFTPSKTSRKKSSREPSPDPVYVPSQSQPVSLLHSQRPSAPAAVASAAAAPAAEPVFDSNLEDEFVGVKRQKASEPELRSVSQDVLEANLEWMTEQIRAGDVYDAQYRARNWAGNVCSSVQSQKFSLSVYQLLSARVLSVLSNPTAGFLAVVDGGVLVLCDSVALMEVLQFHQMQLQLQMPSVPMSELLFIEFEAIGSPVLWDLVRSSHFCHRIFQKNGFVMDTRYFDSRVNKEVIKVSHVPRCCPEEYARDMFVELLKMVGAAHVDHSLGEHTRLHPRAVMEYFKSEAVRMSRQDLVTTTVKAQELLESLASTVAVSPKALSESPDVFRRLFQFSHHNGTTTT